MIKGVHEIEWYLLGFLEVIYYKWSKNLGSWLKEMLMVKKIRKSEEKCLGEDISMIWM